MMKYKIGRSLMSMLLLALALCFTSCGEGAETTSSTMSVTSTAHVHSFGDWALTKEATCVQEGERVRSCACGELERETLSPTGHTPVTDAAHPATCTEEGLTEGSHCEVCHEVLILPTVVEALGHTVVTDKAREVTCYMEGLTEGSHCSVCKTVFVKQESIPTTAHTPVIDPAIPATCAAEGRTEGSHCSVCLRYITQPIKLEKLAHTPTVTPLQEPTCAAVGHKEGTHCAVCLAVLTLGEEIETLPHTVEGNECINCDYLVINYADPSLYDSHYAYDFLGTLKNGEKMQKYYQRLDKVAFEFHMNPSKKVTGLIKDGEYARLESVYYDDLGLSTEEAKMTFYFLTRDRPIYYWLIDKALSYSSSYIYMWVDVNYADGQKRYARNRELSAAIYEFESLVTDETSAYDIALIYHDAIIDAVDYSTDGDWTSRITGVLLEENAACKGYSKTFQLILTLHGVDCIYVGGEVSTGLHAWNIVRLDDGNWYWCDLTWDDISSQEYDGIKYQYFCTDNNQFINWADARTGKESPTKGTKSFVDTHTPWDMEESGYRQLYALPAPSDTAFDSETVLEIGETFVVDGMTFARWNAGGVALVSAPASSTVTVPETVEYGSQTYTVVMLAHTDENGYFITESVIADDAVTEIILPDTLHRIGYRTFRECVNLRSIAIPAGVSEIGRQAFSRCGNLEQVVIAEGVTKIGTEAFAFCEKLTTITLPDSLTTLSTYAFRGCTALTEITLPAGVTSLPDNLFQDCTALRDIYFKGTVTEWNALKKAIKWNAGTGSYTVHCTDGDIAK